MVRFALLIALLATPAAADCLRIEPGDGGSPIIEARLNGQGPFALVLDTAASGSTVDPIQLERLAAPRDNATEEAQGMGGASEVHLYRLASLEAGPLILKDVTVPALPPPDFASHAVVGLAGVDLFGDRLAIWQESCVAVAPSGGRPDGGGWERAPSRWLRPWKVMLPLTLDGVEGWALLDTGAQHTVLNPAFAARLGLTRGRLRPGGEITGIDGRPLPLSEARVGSAQAGAWRWTQPALRVGDLPVFSRLGETDAALAILGMDWLAGRDFALDYGAQIVWQRPAGP